MNIRDLQYLVALADTRHFGKAAERTFVSQPTLSAQLKKLEDFLGAVLIERQPRNVSLTAVGEQIVERARQVLRGCADIEDLAKAARDPLSGILKVALIPTLGPYLLPLIIARLRKALPQLQLMLYEYQTETLLTALRAGDIDLGILALGVNTEGLDTQSLGQDAFHVAMPNTHALAKKTFIRREDLAGQTLLLLEDGHCLRDQALDVCAPIDIQETSNFRATSLETLRQMVSAGYGITLLPAVAIQGPFAASKTLITRPFEAPAPTRTIGSVWRRSSTRLDAITAINQVIAETLEKQTH